MSLPHQKIYVAGHRDMVGSSLVRALLNNGHNSESLILKTRNELDLTDQQAQILNTNIQFTDKATIDQLASNKMVLARYNVTKIEKMFEI